MSGKTLSFSETKLEALTLQSSAQGVVIPLCYGLTRVAGNLLWYGGFKALPATTSQGGKGGVKTQNTSYSYQTSFVLGLCVGQISGIQTVWRGKEVFAGGLAPTQVNTAVETFVPSGAGRTYTVTHAATFLSEAGVYAGTDYPLASGVDYTFDNGALAVLTDRFDGIALQVGYQWASGGAWQPATQQLGMSFSSGALGQSVWSYLSSYVPPGGSAGDQAIPYSGVAIVTAQDYDLGTGAQVQNHSFEILGPMAYHLGSTVPDVDPSWVLRDVLTGVSGGAGFPGAMLGDWTAWSDCCVANGLLVSPAIVQQQKASDLVDTAAKLTNAGPVWSGGRLRMIPYADAAATGNGRTFTPSTTPVYDLDDDSWMAGTSPLKVRAKTPADRYNHVRVQYRDRAAQYADAIAEAKDQADIDTFGLRSMPVLEAPWICTAAAARSVAQLVMQRSLNVVNEYEASLPWHYALLEPMDLVTLTDVPLEMMQAPARVLSITENAEGDLQAVFEDYPTGVSSTPVYPSQGPLGYKPNYNVAPGSVDTPAFFEAPTDWSLTGLEVCVAVRGASANWGGCQVWVSLDGSNYRQVGVVYGGARYGTLSGAVSSGATSMGVQGLGSSQLLSGSAADASQLNTLCYVGGANPEYVAYQTATLTGTGAYTLASLVRQAYGTPAAAHSSGDAFVRVDERVARSGPLDVSYVGKTIYFKFCSFNIYGGAQQGLADVSAYTYAVAGTMVGLPPVDVASFASAAIAGGVKFTWAGNTETDYAETELREGASWAAGTTIFKGRANSYVWPWPTAGSYTVWAKHRDTLGNVSSGNASQAVTVGSGNLVPTGGIQADAVTEVYVVTPSSPVTMTWGATIPRAFARNDVFATLTFTPSSSGSASIWAEARCNYANSAASPAEVIWSLQDVGGSYDSGKELSQTIPASATAVFPIASTRRFNVTAGVTYTMKFMGMKFISGDTVTVDNIEMRVEIIKR